MCLFICLSVCLLGCINDNSKSNERIFLNVFFCVEGLTKRKSNHIFEGKIQMIFRIQKTLSFQRSHFQ